MPKLEGKFLTNLDGTHEPILIFGTDSPNSLIFFTGNKKGPSLLASQNIQLETNREALEMLQATRNFILQFAIQLEITPFGEFYTADNTFVKADNGNVTSDRT